MNLYNTSSSWSLPDNLNTTTDDNTSGLNDVSTNYAGVVHDRNRQLMQSNSHLERQELVQMQLRARERLAFDPRSGRPLYSNWGHGVGASPQSDPATHLPSLPHPSMRVHTSRPDDASGASKGASSRSFPSKVSRSFKGVAYDLSHWDELPPQKMRLGTGQTLSYVLQRENRLSYILITAAVLVVLVLLVCILFKNKGKLVVPVNK